MEVTIPNNWQPRGYQLPAWTYLESGGKRLVLPWHRRAGKDEISLHWSAVSAHLKVGNYWHMLPEAKQARKAIWDAVNPHTGKRRIDEAFPLDIRESTNNQEMFIRFKCGSTWQVVGSDNYDSLVGSPPVGVVFSEWALANPRAWAYLQPILAENGGWAAFIYTPRGKNHGYSMYELASSSDGWFAQKLNVEETGILTHAQIEQQRDEYIKLYGKKEGIAMFRQEWYCDFDAALPGAYYLDQLTKAKQESRIGRVHYDPTLKVHTAWDLGMSDSTSIWFFQTPGTELRVIDYFEASGEPLSFYAKVLQDKGYIYGQHIGPHDLEVRELGTGKSRIEVARSLGITFRVARNLPVNDGIQAVRNMFPRFYFDEQKCKQGLEALHSYRKEWDDKRQEFKPHPLHDWSSHAADALRYFAVGFIGDTKQQQPLEIDTRYIV